MKSWDKLWDIHQNRAESIHEYYNRWQLMAKPLENSHWLSEEGFLNAFIKSLHKWHQEWIAHKRIHKKKDWKNIKELVDDLWKKEMEREQVLAATRNFTLLQRAPQRQQQEVFEVRQTAANNNINGKKKQPNKRNNFQCGVCGKKGHTDEFCFKLKNLNNNTQKGSQSTRKITHTVMPVVVYAPTECRIKPFTIDALFGDTEFTALVDTGATYGVCNCYTADEFRKCSDVRVVSLSQPVEFGTGWGSKVIVKKALEGPLTVLTTSEGVTCGTRDLPKVHLLVIEDLRQEVIFGRDILGILKVSIRATPQMCQRNLQFASCNCVDRRTCCDMCTVPNRGNVFSTTVEPPRSQRYPQQQRPRHSNNSNNRTQRNGYTRPQPRHKPPRDTAPSWKLSETAFQRIQQKLNINCTTNGLLPQNVQQGKALPNCPEGCSMVMETMYQLNPKGKCLWFNPRWNRLWDVTRWILETKPDQVVILVPNFPGKIWYEPLTQAAHAEMLLAGDTPNLFTKPDGTDGQSKWDYYALLLTKNSINKYLSRLSHAQTENMMLQWTRERIQRARK